MHAEVTPNATTGSLDDEIREAVREVMAGAESAEAKQQLLVRVQELLERKAALVRAPFSEKVRRIKETA